MRKLPPGTALLVLVALSIGTPAALAAFQGENGRLAVVRSVSLPPTSPNVWTVLSDGTDPFRVTQNSFSGDPTWSADGKQIAFTEHIGDFFVPNVSLTIGRVWKVNADGTGLTQVTEGPNDGHPTWSADGTKIAFHRFDLDPYRSTVFVTNSNGTGETPLHSGFDPAWSPDGARIAFSDGPEIQSDIWVANADGTSAARLTTHTLTADEWSFNEASWSGDGSRIAFSNEEIHCFYNICETESGGPRLPFREVHVMNSDGTGRTRITSAQGALANPAFSPRGDQIAADDQHDGGGVWVMNADGMNLHRVMNARDPDWQAIPGPRRQDYKNAAQFCAAQRGFLGDAEFTRRYATGNGRNAHGKCVSRN